MGMQITFLIAGVSAFYNFYQKN